ncbi:MAG: XisI protein [Saprospiraceae bacterium]
MDKVKKYQEILVGLLQEYAVFLAGSNSPVKPQVIADREGNHFQLMKSGWDAVSQRFVFGILFHFDIIEGKIWLQLNNTEFYIADELEERGVPKSDIVLGFQPPVARQERELAVA